MGCPLTTRVTLSFTTWVVAQLAPRVTASVAARTRAPRGMSGRILIATQTFDGKEGTGGKGEVASRAHMYLTGDHPADPVGELVGEVTEAQARVTQESVISHQILAEPVIEDRATDSHQCKGLSLIHISEPTRQAEISYAVFCL